MRVLNLAFSYGLPIVVSSHIFGVTFVFLLIGLFQEPLVLWLVLPAGMVGVGSAGIPIGFIWLRVRRKLQSPESAMMAELHMRHGGTLVMPSMAAPIAEPHLLCAVDGVKVDLRCTLMPGWNKGWLLQLRTGEPCSWRLAGGSRTDPLSIPAGLTEVRVGMAEIDARFAWLSDRPEAAAAVLAEKALRDRWIALLSLNPGKTSLGFGTPDRSTMGLLLLSVFDLAPDAPTVERLLQDLRSLEEGMAALTTPAATRLSPCLA